MKLFTKEINDKLFKQYPKGADLNSQMAVAKIFNPYGNGRWFLLNSDPEDPNYLWAIVEMGKGNVEMGSVSRKELESIRVTAWRFPLERDLSFRPRNAKEIYDGLLQGKHFEEGGHVSDENKEMVLNQVEGFEHHADELEKAVKKADEVPAWVVAKSQRASTDLGDITHYLDGQNAQKREKTEGEEYADGGMVNREFNMKVKQLAEKKGLVPNKLGRDYELNMAQATVSALGDANFHAEARKLVSLLEKEPWSDELYKSEYYNAEDEIDEFGREVARLSEWDGSDIADAFIYILKMNGQQRLAMTIDKAMEEGNYAMGGRLDVGRYYKTKDGRQVRYLGDTTDPELGTFMNKADGVFKVRYDEIQGKASLFEEGGETEEGVDLFEDYDEIPPKVQKVLDKHSVAFEDGDYRDLEKAVKELEKIGYTFEYGLDGQAYDLRKIGQKGKSEVGDDEYASGGMTDPMATVNEIARLSGVRPIAVAEWGDKNNINLTIVLKDLKSKKIKGMDIMTAIVGNPNNKYQKELLAKYSKMASGGMMADGGKIDMKRYEIREGKVIFTSAKTFADFKKEQKQNYSSIPSMARESAMKSDWKIIESKMAMGGKVKFADKVESVKKSLLERKKVPKVVQKDYGKTFSPAEAEDSAKRIVGAQTARERLMARMKSKKKK